MLTTSPWPAAQTECNTHDARAAAAFKVAFMRRRDKVVEIVSIGGGMFTVLLGNGVCGAFRIRTYAT